ncbi:SDR family NAD(P)-dependent oxidoreductase [Streptomyces sp. NPDC051684]|uniref:SDR family NAD(P)-dependent oxidoreductase n=1 Tax=Streptomyces sp. NPDC051684 TaxID=3365670 RepID=UPI00378B34FE
MVTGGSRGIGHCLVQSFIQDTDVLNISRKSARIAGVRTEHELHNLNLDLADVTLVEPCVRAWLDEHPEYQVTTLVHNAATSNLGWLHEVPAEQVEEVFRVNVHAPLAITSAVFSAGRFADGGARVAYVVSSLGRALPELSFAGLGLYSTTKAALGRMALVQAREFEISAPHIKVLRIHPGIVDTEIQQELRRNERLDQRFALKTAGLPPYQEGEWQGTEPKDRMRTVSAEFAAEFIAWAVRREEVEPGEYDFYHAQEFHEARRS